MMKKKFSSKTIGILSMQRVINYGSFLQAFALKKLIENEGFNVSFIDIKRQKNSIYYFLYSFRNLFLDISKSFLSNQQYKFEKMKVNKFTLFISKYLALEEKLYFSSNYYKTIIGSDEVFNIKQHSPWRYNLQLFGEGLQGSIYTYAASFGNTSYDFILKSPLKLGIRDNLKKIKLISVRDYNSFQIILNLTGSPPIIHLDPTLIYDFEDEIKPINTSFKYILIYSYDGRIKVNSQIRQLINFAKVNNYKLLGLGSYISFCDLNILPDPFELLSYFKQASYVLTDTFHGTIFSILYHKQFATFVRKSNKIKLNDLMERFKVNNRRISPNDSIIKILNDSYDTDHIDKVISSCKIQTNVFLQKVLFQDFI
jgi:hypothetical protein